MPYPGEILAYMRQIAASAVAGQLKTKIGFVSSYNPQTYCVRVRLEPESKANEQFGQGAIETNWLPILRTYGGNGWGMIAPPLADPNPPYGDMAIVVWPDGGHGIAIVGFYNDVERAFVGPVAGEWWLTHKDGAFIKVLNDGAMLMQGKNGNVVEMRANGDVDARSAGGAELSLQGGDAQLTASGGGRVLCTGAQVRIN